MSASTTLDRGSPEETRNKHVHPAFASLLNGFASVPADALAIQRATYVSLLVKQDWSAEFSDDGDVARRGRASLRELRMLQRELDPEFELWNRHVPAACLNGKEFT